MPNLVPIFRANFVLQQYTIPMQSEGVTINLYELPHSLTDLDVGISSAQSFIIGEEIFSCNVDAIYEKMKEASFRARLREKTLLFADFFSQSEKDKREILVRTNIPELGGKQLKMHFWQDFCHCCT